MDNKFENRIHESPSNLESSPEPRGLGANYFDILKKHGKKIAQIDAETGETSTYEDILLRSICVAQEMSARRITSDDIISLCTYNHMNTCLPILAATYLLTKVASLGPTLCIDDMKYMLNLVKPRMLFVTIESVETVETAINEIELKCEIVVFGDTRKYIPFKEFLVERGTEVNFKPKIVKDIFETAFIFFSSGTSGLPKAICVHHYGLQHAFNLFSSSPYTQRSLMFVSPHGITHLIAFSAIISSGGRNVITRAFDENNILKIIEKFQVSLIYLQPTMTYGITSNPNYQKYDRLSLKIIYCGGSKIAESQIFALEKIFPNATILISYGLTEVCGAISVFDPIRDIKLIQSKKASSGKVIPGISFKVVNLENETIVAPNQQGELLVKSRILMNCYYNKPEETKNCFTEDGYFRTGDIVYFDEDQCIYVIDRIKEMFKFRSFHIVPAELENIILTHVAVKEAIVIGYPHEEDGDHPMAVVVLKDGATVTEKDIALFLNEKVSDRKMLRGGVRFVKSIPKTVTGKYNRRVMRNIIISNTQL